MKIARRIALAVIATLAGAGPWDQVANAASAPRRIDFNRDIRPILSEQCFACHGQDKRKGGLRLDTFAGATAADDEGAALVPGDPDASRLIARIVSTDDDERMPPPETHRWLTGDQVDLLRAWIQQGGAYQKHWAFVSPRRVPTPAVTRGEWIKHPIDAFIAARLESEGLEPAPEVAAEVWLRRVSFDLVGLGPVPDEIDAFVADVASRGEAAYRAVVERLLASPRFGERMAQEWLDVARYADTHGFNNDSERSMWRWRDWVIDAFNSNMPYDRFITEQLAGDLLPGATMAQRLATGFGRNHVINSEGGIIDEEYRVEYVADRVRTLGMAWLGLTLECARCHDHKFDPIAQKDYYRFFGFFNNVPEWGEDGRVENAAPMMPAPTQIQQTEQARLEAELARLDRLVETVTATHQDHPPVSDWLDGLRVQAIGTPAPPTGTQFILDQSQASGVQTHAILGPLLHLDGQGTLDFGHESRLALWIDDPWTFAVWIKWSGDEAAVISTMDYEKPQSSVSYGAGSEVRITASGQVELRLSRRWPVYALQAISTQALKPNQWHHLVISQEAGGKARGIRIYIDGRMSDMDAPYDGLNPAWKEKRPELPVRIGWSTSAPVHPFKGALADMRVFDRVIDADEVTAWSRQALSLWLASTPARDEARERRPLVRDLFLRLTDRAYRWAADERDRLHMDLLALKRTFPTVMVMSELPTVRNTHVLNRGLYDAPGEQVEPGVPEGLLVPWPKGAPVNRLGLARWLTRPDHPLTARVVVNRLWQQLFGTGLVKTSEDFGYQGEYPSHPELLDWLARTFVDGGWDLKSLLRGLVLSASYRQDTAVSSELAARDPENRLLARGPRVRLSAETIRDHLLSSSGLLRHRLGGPSVFPYQPADLYQGIVVVTGYPGSIWTDSKGDDLYRRSLYTYWKRTVLHPMMGGFDAPDREVCSVRRARTNTPLQALTLMNEPGAVEAARHLAQRLLIEGGRNDREKLTFAFRLATARQPRPHELRVLLRQLAHFRASFAVDRAGARALLRVGASATLPNVRMEELAAFTAITNLIYNLDETITKG